MTTNLPSSTAVELPLWGLIRARGADAASFLHGQLTQDVLHLGPAEARLAGYCSAKGRLLASFVMWKPNEQEVLLACHASVLAATLKRLSMFVMRAKAKLSDASADFVLCGVTGDLVAALGGDGTQVWSRTQRAAASLVVLPPGASVVPDAALVPARVEAAPVFTCGGDADGPVSRDRRGSASSRNSSSTRSRTKACGSPAKTNSPASC